MVPRALKRTAHSHARFPVCWAVGLALYDMCYHYVTGDVFSHEAWRRVCRPSDLIPCQRPCVFLSCFSCLLEDPLYGTWFTQTLAHHSIKTVLQPKNGAAHGVSKYVSQKATGRVVFLILERWSVGEVWMAEDWNWHG